MQAASLHCHKLRYCTVLPVHHTFLIIRVLAVDRRAHGGTAALRCLSLNVRSQVSARGNLDCRHSDGMMSSLNRDI